MRRLANIPCRGEQSPRAKTNEADVRLMRQLAEAGLSTRAIAEKFDLSQKGVWKILNYHTWNHVRD